MCSPGTGRARRLPKGPGRRPAPCGAPGPVPGAGGFGRLRRRLGAAAGLGGGWTRREEHARGGSRAAPHSQVGGRHPGGAAGFPRSGLPARGGRGAAARSASQLRAAPGLSKAGGGSLQGFPERCGQEEGRGPEEGRGRRAGGEDPERAGAALPAPPPEPRRARSPPPGAPAPLRSRRECGPGGRG